MARCLIIGFGYVGQALASALKNEGHEVYGLCRSPKRTDIQMIFKDIHELKAADVPAVDYVFYMVSADEYSEQAYQKAYVEGVDAVLKALANQSVQRFIFISSTGVYPQKEGEWVDEDTHIEPSTFSSKALYRGEQLVESNPIPSTTLRFAGIYGPGRARLIDQVKTGKATWTDKPYYTNRIHIDDCVGVCLHVLRHNAPLNCYNVVDNMPVLMNEVLTFLADYLNVTVSGTHSPKRGHKKCSNRRLLNDGYTLVWPNYKVGYMNIMQNEAP